MNVNTQFFYFSVPPKVELKEKVYTFLVKSDQVIEARVGGIPFPDVKWFKDEVLIEKIDFIHCEQEENISRLKFSQLKLDGAGVYKCVAENTIGKAEAKTSVVVQGKVYKNVCVVLYAIDLTYCLNETKKTLLLAHYFIVSMSFCLNLQRSQVS